MDLEQMLKRLQWVEDERRKEKDLVAMLENRINTLEGALAASNQQFKDLSLELSRLATITNRLDQFEETFTQQRLEARKLIEDVDKDVKRREEETEKVRRLDVKSLESAIADVKKDLEPLPRLEKAIQGRVEEEGRLRRTIDEVREKIDGVRRDEEEYTRSYRLLEDSRRQDAKRLLDLQGEATALRKRVDDQRAQGELYSNNLRKVEVRLNELATIEAERREVIANFLDKQTLAQVERDRIWKEWQTRFETIEKQATDVESQLLNLDTMQREARRYQGILEELAQKVDRRINEITEIQRLAEERFRQEWVTFKADDQKRWTNYTLTQEEQRGETLRQFQKFTEQVTGLEDGLQEVQDLLQQVNEQTEKRLQSLLAMAHEWVTAYERTVGRAR